MAVSQEGLGELLSEAGVKVAAPLGSALLFAVECGDDKLPVLLDRTDDGKMIQFRTANMMQAPEPSYRGVLLRALMSANDGYKLVKFAFDANDGEVVVYADLVLGDARPTATQIKRCINAFRTVVLPMRSRLQEIVKTGEDPGEPETGPPLGALLEMLSSMKALQGEGAAQPGKGAPAPKRTNRGFDDIVGDILKKGG